MHNRYMIIKHFYLDKEQVDFLKKLSGNASGHIRRALDDYILKILKESIPKVSASQSGRESDKNE